MQFLEKNSSLCQSNVFVYIVFDTTRNMLERSRALALIANRGERRSNLFEDVWLTWFAYLPSPKIRGLCRNIQMPANRTSANHIASFQGRKSIQIEVVNKEARFLTLN